MNRRLQLTYVIIMATWSSSQPFGHFQVQKNPQVALKKSTNSNNALTLCAVPSIGLLTDPIIDAKCKQKNWQGTCMHEPADDSITRLRSLAWRTEQCTREEAECWTITTANDLVACTQGSAAAVSIIPGILTTIWISILRFEFKIWTVHCQWACPSIQC